MGVGMTCATTLFDGVAQGSAGAAKQLAAPLRHPLAPLKGGIRVVARGDAPKPAAAVAQRVSPTRLGAYCTTSAGGQEGRCGCRP
jgi:hypothetical protein